MTAATAASASAISVDKAVFAAYNAFGDLAESAELKVADVHQISRISPPVNVAYCTDNKVAVLEEPKVHRVPEVPGTLGFRNSYAATSTLARSATSGFKHTPRRPYIPHSSVANTLIAVSAASFFSASNAVPKNSNIPNCKSSQDNSGKDEKKCQICHRKKYLNFLDHTVCQACYEFYQDNLERQNTLICVDNSVYCDITNLSKGYSWRHICRRCRMDKCRWSGLEPKNTK